MMFDELRQNSELFGLIRHECNENRIFVEFDEQLDEDKYIILKPDIYYNSLKIEKRPPSADCLIIVRCGSKDEYDFYLIELKDIKDSSGFDIKNIEQKFRTVIDDFLTKKFGEIFLNKYKIRKLYILFISDPYRFGKNITQEEFNKRMKGLKFEAFQALKPLVFRGKAAFITPSLPHLIRITPC